MLPIMALDNGSWSHVPYTYPNRHIGAACLRLPRMGREPPIGHQPLRPAVAAAQHTCRGDHVWRPPSPAARHLELQSQPTCAARHSGGDKYLSVLNTLAAVATQGCEGKHAVSTITKRAHLSSRQPIESASQAHEQAETRRPSTHRNGPRVAVISCARHCNAGNGSPHHTCGRSGARREWPPSCVPFELLRRCRENQQKEDRLLFWPRKIGKRHVGTGSACGTMTAALATDRGWR